MSSIPTQELVQDTRSVSSEYVLPVPPRRAPELIVQAVPAGEVLALRRESAVLQAVGERIGLLLDCQQRFLDELRAAVADLEADAAEAARARLRGQVHGLEEILDWCGAVQEDLERESRRAIAGERPTDLLALAGRAAEAAEGRHPGVRISVRGGPGPWSGNPVGLWTVLEAALDLVAARIGGNGPVAVEIEERNHAHSLRITGAGEPRPVTDAALLDRFRDAMQGSGMAATPDDLGAAGAGMVLQLPLPEQG